MGQSTEVMTVRGALQLFAFGCACTLSFAVVTPIVVIGAIMLSPFVRPRYRRTASEEVIDEIETSLLEGKSYRLQQAWSSYKSGGLLGGAGDWKVHSLIAKSQSTPPKRDLVFVHGYGGSCIAFLPAFDYLRKNFNIHAPDLPGFGRGHGPPLADDAAAGTKLDYICDFLHGYLLEHQITEAHLVGHSFGAYICTHFAKRYPDLVVKLILVDIAGAFPVQSSSDSYLAIAYKVHPLHAICQAAGNFGVWVCYTWFSYLKAPPKTYHLIQRNANRAGNVGAAMFGDLVSLGYTECYGKASCLSTLLRLKVPVALVWGRNDPLIPLEQARMLLYLMGADSKCFVVEDGSHSPVEVNGKEQGESFSKAVEMAVVAAGRLPETAAQIAALVEENEGTFLSFRASFDSSASKEAVAALYSWAQSLAIGVGAQAKPGLDDSQLVFVR
jgi:pimeloyl-ACP methyl ester carboxylesterase